MRKPETDHILTRMLESNTNISDVTLTDKQLGKLSVKLNIS